MSLISLHLVRSMESHRVRIQSSHSEFAFRVRNQSSHFQTLSLSKWRLGKLKANAMRIQEFEAQTLSWLRVAGFSDWALSLMFCELNSSIWSQLKPIRMCSPCNAEYVIQSLYASSKRQKRVFQPCQKTATSIAAIAASTLRFGRSEFRGLNCSRSARIKR